MLAPNSKGPCKPTVWAWRAPGDTWRQREELQNVVWVRSLLARTLSGRRAIWECLLNAYRAGVDPGCFCCRPARPRYSVDTDWPLFSFLHSEQPAGRGQACHQRADVPRLGGRPPRRHAVRYGALRQAPVVTPLSSRGW